MAERSQEKQPQREQAGSPRYVDMPHLSAGILEYPGLSHQADRVVADPFSNLIVYALGQDAGKAFAANFQDALSRGVPVPDAFNQAYEAVKGEGSQVNLAANHVSPDMTMWTFEPPAEIKSTPDTQDKIFMMYNPSFHAEVSTKGLNVLADLVRNAEFITDHIITHGRFSLQSEQFTRSGMEGYEQAISLIRNYLYLQQQGQEPLKAEYGDSVKLATRLVTDYLENARLTFPEGGTFVVIKANDRPKQFTSDGVEIIQGDDTKSILQLFAKQHLGGVIPHTILAELIETGQVSQETMARIEQVEPGALEKRQQLRGIIGDILGNGFVTAEQIQALEGILSTSEIHAIREISVDQNLTREERQAFVWLLPQRSNINPAYDYFTQRLIDHDREFSQQELAHMFFVAAQQAGTVARTEQNFLSAAITTDPSQERRVRSYQRLADDLRVSIENIPQVLPERLRLDAAQLMLDIAKYTSKRMRRSPKVLSAMRTSLGVNRFGFYTHEGKDAALALGSGRGPLMILEGRGDEENTRYLLDNRHGNTGAADAMANPMGIYHMRLRSDDGDTTARRKRELMTMIDSHFGQLPYRLALAQTVEAAKFYAHNLPPRLWKRVVEMDRRLQEAGEAQPQIQIGFQKVVSYQLVKTKEGMMQLPVLFEPSLQANMEEVMERIRSNQIEEDVRNFLAMAATYNAGQRLTDRQGWHSLPRLEYVAISSITGRQGQYRAEFIGHQQSYYMPRRSFQEESQVRRFAVIDLS